MLSIQILFGLGLPLLLLTRVDGISSKGLLTVGLHYIAFHSLKVSVYNNYCESLQWIYSRF